MFTPKPQLTSDTSLEGSSPPVVHIPREVRRSSKVNDAYSAALDEHGPVIIVPRHGRNEYVIDHRYAHEVLTDTKNFTFEKAVFDLLHLGFLAVFDNGEFVRDIDSLIEKNVQPRMNAIIDQVVPVFEKYFDNMADEVRDLTHDRKFVEFPDVFRRIQLAIAHAMVVMILGQEHASSKTAGYFASVAVAMASMTGLHENTDEWVMFPRLWVLFNGFCAIFLTIIPKFFFTVTPMLWKARRQHLENGLAARHGDFVPLFDILLTKHYHEQTGIWAVFGFFRCVILCVGVIFASIHQTVVAGSWILIKLTQKQDDYLPAIREEWESINRPGESLDVKKLTQLTHLDSFIREVLRTKGDTWGPLRQTTRPVRVGPYVLPKNAMCIVLISRAHRHPDNYGTVGEVFDGFQWQKTGRAAVQGSPEFLTFGLGRWACPGRQLAIHEIKIVLYMFFSKFDIRLKENTFRIIDHINTTSIAPEATLMLGRRQGDTGLATTA
ncbi:putative cytochrome P450 [Rosellinia necatrix]|uniref:Putative cytochrome P450 n=1 Tax=Rosellinia necatrix TaxID=77044 RepID=A0A1W2TQE9_ROSNE|nr:putative cytochrome P450 [Rosellinia necatrix]